jgi:hypothetical protein
LQTGLVPLYYPEIEPVSLRISVPVVKLLPLLQAVSFRFPCPCGLARLFFTYLPDLMLFHTFRYVPAFSPAPESW